MKAAVLVRKGTGDRAFEIREAPKPKPGTGEVLIRVECFGLNYADVMARKGLYRDAPPMPCIIGYDVVGRIEEGNDSRIGLQIGDRVAAMTHFGGYAEYVVANVIAVIKIDDTVPGAVENALITQYCTAQYAASEMVNLHENDKVLIHSAAGGVGTALLQYALYKKCEVFATAGSASKCDSLLTAGARHVINYSKDDFAQVVKDKTKGQGVDVIFDAVGGSSVKRGISCLASGGKMVCYGASSITNKNIFGKLNTLLGFGFYHPVSLLTKSISIMGLNMLRIVERNPHYLRNCLDDVLKLYKLGVYKPHSGGEYPISQLGKAHDLLENRKTTERWLFFGFELTIND